MDCKKQLKIADRLRFRDARDAVAGLFLVIMLLAAFGGCHKNEDAVDMQELMTGLHDADPGLRYSAVKQLGNAGKGAADAVPALIAALNDPDPGVRIGVTYALAKIGPAASLAVQPLAVALRDKDPEVRAGAAYALPCLGPAAASAMPALTAAAHYRNPAVRTQADLRKEADARKEAEEAIRKIQSTLRFKDAAARPAAEPQPE